MNILALSPWFPYPPDNGSKLRIFNLLKQLSRKHRITLLAMTAEDEGSQQNIAALRHWCQDVKTVPKRVYRPDSPVTWLGFFSFWPRHHIQTFSSEMRDSVASEIQSGRVDLCIAFEFGTVRYLAGYEHIPRVFEEAELTKMIGNVTRQANPLLMLRHQLPWWKTRWLVRWVAREFDLCTVVSEQEQRLLQQLIPYYRSIAVIPNGVDVDHYAGDFGQPKEDSLIFSGALTYSANYDAMEFFLGDILPLIKKERPEVVLRITGKTAGVPLEQLPNVDDVIFTGYLDDVRPSVAQSWVSVVPLRVGGGTRLKILEAMALGTPVVSTSKGAEGLDVTLGENILIADTPSGFADATLHLLEDHGLRARLSENGRSLVRTRYDWAQIGEEFERLLSDIVKDMNEL
jgi:glycosyltransferase involved in cell wall biosynthesis